MIILSARNITKTFGVNTVLKDLSLYVQEGEKIGLIGNNGSGKTTLMRILAEDLEADEGSVQLSRGKTFGYLRQQADFKDDRSVWETCRDAFSETIALGEEIRRLTDEIASRATHDAEYDRLLSLYQAAMDDFEAREGYQVESKIRGVLQGLGFDESQLEQSVTSLSGGQKSRVMLARLLLEKPDILLMDEPTNHLDLDAVRWLEDFLKTFSGTLILISHDRYFLDAVTNRTAYLDDSLTTYDGNYTVFMEKHRQALKHQKHAYENQQREIERQEEMIRRFENYGNKRYILQARSRRRMLAQMDRVERPDAPDKKMNLRLTPARESGRDVLDVEGLGMRFTDSMLFSGVDFHVSRGERIGIIGPNGVGKTTLFRILKGEIPPVEGTYRFGTGVKLGYLDQEQDSLKGENTILDEIWDHRPELKHGEIRNILATFLFYGDDIFRSVEDLSGGEKARVALCKLMLSKSNTLLLDEPTNHLDIQSKEALEAACLEYTGTLIFISHDRYFLNRVARRILDFRPDGVRSYLGNYNYYLEKSAPEEIEEPATVNKTREQKQRKKDKAGRKAEKESRARRIAVEASIHSMEERLQSLDTELSDPALYTRPERLIQLSEDRSRLERDLQDEYAIWMELLEE